MSSLYVMVGIPGSGKSTIAKQLVDSGNADLIFSSDDYRGKVLGNVNDQDNNKLVFSSLYKDMLEALKEDKNCVFDATNINRKDRKTIINYCNNIDCNIYAVLVIADVQTAKERNKHRDRIVPEKVIDSFVSKFEIPFTGEGFDDIIYYRNCDDNNFLSIGDALMKTKGFNQLNPHHTLDLFHHMTECFKYVASRTVNKELLIASLIHDIGKVDTQTIDKDGIGHYYRHENVGAYNSFFIKDTSFGIPIDMYKVAFYINYHMEPYRLRNAKETTLERYKNMFGAEWDNILLLHEADDKSH